MKKRIIITILLVVLLATTKSAKAQGEKIVLQHRIRDFQVILKINTNSSVDVHEIIDYDFGLDGKRGMIRDLPTQYQSRLGHYKIRVSNLEVIGRDFTTEQNANNLRVRIGDADKMLVGQQRFELKYTISYAFGYFATFDEFFWNAVGGQGTIAADSSAVAVLLPIPVEASDIKAACYVGPFGTDNKCELIQPSLDENQKIIAIKFAQNKLAANQTLAISVGLPKGIMKEPGIGQMLSEFFIDFYLYGLLILAVGSSIYWQLKRKRKKRKNNIEIV